MFLPLYTSFKFDQNCKPAYFDIPLHNTVVVNTAFVKLLHGTFLFGQKCQNRFQFHLTTFCPLTKQKLHFCFCPQHTTRPPPLAPLYAHTHTHTHAHTHPHTHTHTHTHKHTHSPTPTSLCNLSFPPSFIFSLRLPSPTFHLSSSFCLSSLYPSVSFYSSPLLHLSPCLSLFDSRNFFLFIICHSLPPVFFLSPSFFLHSLSPFLSIPAPPSPPPTSICLSLYLYLSLSPCLASLPLPFSRALSVTPLSPPRGLTNPPPRPIFIFSSIHLYRCDKKRTGRW